MKYEQAAIIARYADTRWAEEVRLLRAYLDNPGKYAEQRRRVQDWKEATEELFALLAKFDQPEAETVTTELPTIQEQE